MAIWRRGKSDALLHHSDQGSQYTSQQFQTLMSDNGDVTLTTRIADGREHRQLFVSSRDASS
jgi:transposase InsO family protein